MSNSNKKSKSSSRQASASQVKVSTGGKKESGALSNTKKHENGQK